MGQVEIRSIKRAAAVLRCIAFRPNGLTLSSICELTALSKATVHRILHTLATDDLVRADGGQYFPGPLFLVLARDSDSHREIKEIAEPRLIELRNATGETAALVVRRGLERVTISVALSRHELKAAPEIGSAKPIHAGAAGKSLLAFLDADELNQILHGYRFSRVAANTTTSLSQMLRDLQKARQQGYATSVEESVGGQAAIAAPILVDGTVVGVINLSIPIVRATRRALREWLPTVTAAAKTVANAQRARTKGVKQIQTLRRTRG